MRTIRTENDVDAMAIAARGFGVLAAWVENGYLSVLRERGPISLGDLDGDLRALQITAPILSHLGILASDGERWELTESACNLMDQGSLGLPTPSRFFGSLSQLSQVLRDGEPCRAPDGSSLVSEGGVREDNFEDTKAFLEMLYRRSDYSSKAVFLFLRPLLPEGAHVLDLGGGHGRYAEVFARDGHEVTLFDRPVCVSIARQRYRDLLHYREGNFLEDSPGGPYDVAILSNIVHGLGPEENRNVLQRVADSLRPGGLLFIKDMFIGPHGAYPENAVFFGLIMLSFTREGRSYTLEEMDALLKSAGVSPERHHYDSDGRFSFLLARK